jgi:ribosomal protein RSM22 (predicted rRNA methylase)
VSQAPSAPELAAEALESLGAFLDEQRPGWSDDVRLLSRARALSTGFTEDDVPRTPRADAETALAYLAYFGPRTIAAASEVVSWAGRAALPSRAVDLGAGTGAGALVLACAGVPSLTLIDHDGDALAVATRLVARARPDVVVRTQTASLTDRTSGRGAPWVFSAFTLGELGDNKDAEARLEAVSRFAAKDGELLLIDAGDRRRARSLMEMREAWLARGHHVRAPCSHEDACPALERRRDWCHTRAPRRLDERFAAFARAVGRDDEQMSFHYLLLTREAVAHPGRALRVIGEARNEKGRVRLPVCGPDGVRFLQALKRSPETCAALEAAPRGARLPWHEGWEPRQQMALVREAEHVRADAGDDTLVP